MTMDIIFSDAVLSTQALGILAAFVTGLLTLIPYLGATDFRRNLTAIVVLVIGVFAYTAYEFTTFQNLFVTVIQAAVYAVVTYKFFLQNIIIPPVERTIASFSPRYAAAKGITPYR